MKTKKPIEKCCLSCSVKPEPKGLCPRGCHLVECRDGYWEPDRWVVKDEEAVQHMRVRDREGSQSLAR